jgi:hypothetical protein
MDGSESDKSKSVRSESSPTQSVDWSMKLSANDHAVPQTPWTVRYNNNRIREQCHRLEDTFVSVIRDLTDKDYHQIKKAVANNESLEVRGQEFLNIYVSMHANELETDIKNFNSINQEVGLNCLENAAPEVQSKANSLIDEINASARDFLRLSRKGISHNDSLRQALADVMQGDRAALNLAKILDSEARDYKEQQELFSTHLELARKARKVIVGCKILCESLDTSPLTWGDVNSKAIAFGVEALGGDSEHDLSTDGYPNGIKIGARQVVNSEKVSRRMQMLAGYVDDLMKSYHPDELRALENNPKLDPVLTMAMQQLRLHIAQDLPKIQQLKDYTGCGAGASFKKMEKFSWELYGLDKATETMNWYSDSLQRKIKDGSGAPDIWDRYCNDKYLLRE